MAYARLSDTIHVPTEMLTWSGNSGPEWFLFPHTMDIVRWLFGREPIEVYAKGYRGVLDGMGIRCWDAIQAIVEFEGRAFCTFETSWIVPASYTNVVDNRLSLYGEKGGLEIRNEPNLWAFTDRFHTPFSSESVTRYGKAWGFQYEPIRYFVDCVADGITPEVSGHDGLMVTAMIEATLRSLAERRPVANRGGARDRPARGSLMTALFVLVRIVANPLSNVYQKQLTQKAANPVFIIGAVHAVLTLACVPVWLVPGAMVLRRGPELWATMAACAVLAVAGNALLVAAVRSTDLSILGPINAYKVGASVSFSGSS